MPIRNEKEVIKCRDEYVCISVVFRAQISLTVVCL